MVIEFDVYIEKTQWGLGILLDLQDWRMAVVVGPFNIAVTPS